LDVEERDESDASSNKSSSDSDIETGDYLIDNEIRSSANKELPQTLIQPAFASLTTESNNMNDIDNLITRSYDDCNSGHESLSDHHTLDDSSYAEKRKSTSICSDPSEIEERSDTVPVIKKAKHLASKNIDPNWTILPGK
jgi:hypothetical protein